MLEGFGWQPQDEGPVTIKSSSKEGGHNESKNYRYFGGNYLGHDDF